MFLLNRIRGLSIIEVIVAAVLFLAFSIPLMSLLSTSKFTNKRQENRVQALMLAQGIIEEINHNSEQYNNIRRRHRHLEINGFKANIRYEPFDPNIKELLLITVSVNWKHFNKQQNLEIISLISLKKSFYKFPKLGYR